jgi:uncharacterized membrane protein
MPAKESHARSITKGITWRIVGTLDTLVVSWFVLHETTTAGNIAIWDTLIKFLLYYGHERLWQNVPLGVVRQYKLFKNYAKTVIPKDYHESVVKKESHIRSVLKGISWRATGTITTIMVAYFLTGEIGSALQIGGIEVITKFVLYYIHERAWQRIPRGGFRKIFKRNG